jgi:hypothetical protein
MDRSAIAAGLGGPSAMSEVAGDLWITITVLRRQFHRALRDVERGTTFTVVRRRRPVARLVPLEAAKPSLQRRQS